MEVGGVRAALALLAVLLLAGCATLPGHGAGAGEEVTRAQVRAEAESRLIGCLGWSVRARPSPAQKQACVAESRSFCRARGLEATCGVSGLWSRASSLSRRR